MHTDTCTVLQCGKKKKRNEAAGRSDVRCPPGPGLRVLHTLLWRRQHPCTMHQGWGVCSLAGHAPATRLRPPGTSLPISHLGPSSQPVSSLALCLDGSRSAFRSRLKCHHEAPAPGGAAPFSFVTSPGTFLPSASPRWCPLFALLFVSPCPSCSLSSAGF